MYFWVIHKVEIMLMWAWQFWMGNMKVFAMYIEEKLKELFCLDACCFIAWKKRHVHFAFKQIIYDYDCFERLMSFVADECEKKKLSITDYRMIYPRCISSIK